MVAVTFKTKKRKSSVDRCEASGHRIVGRDFYSVSYKGDVCICDQCGKEIKLIQRGEGEYIPTHNVPK